MALDQTSCVDPLVPGSPGWGHTAAIAWGTAPCCCPQGNWRWFAGNPRSGHRAAWAWDRLEGGSLSCLGGAQGTVAPQRKPCFLFPDVPSEIKERGEFNNERGERKVCRFKLEWLGNCSGINDETYGYKEGKPCVLIKLNRVLGFKPKVSHALNPRLWRSLSPSGEVADGHEASL